MKDSAPDGEMEHLPDVELGELWHHLLGEEPVGHGRALDDLRLEELVDQHDHHLLVGLPHVEDAPQHRDLGLFLLAQELK